MVSHPSNDGPCLEEKYHAAFIMLAVPRPRPLLLDHPILSDFVQGRYFLESDWFEINMELGTGGERIQKLCVQLGPFLIQLPCWECVLLIARNSVYQHGVQKTPTGQANHKIRHV